MTDNTYGGTQYGNFSYGVRLPHNYSRTVSVYGTSGSISTTRDPISRSRQTTLTVTGEQSTVISNFVNVFANGLVERAITFDEELNAFVTDWQYENQWTDGDTFSVRLVSGIETQPIDVKVQRDDTGNGEIDETSEWKTVTARETPIIFPDVSNGEAQYRILLRYVRPDDFVRNIDTGFVHP